MPELQRSPDAAPVESPPARWAGEESQPAHVHYDQDCAIMFAHGALDFAFIGHLEKALDAALGDDPPRIWLDLTDVWLMDASVLRILLAFQRRAAAAGCTFRVVGATGIVRRVFEITDTLQSLSD